MSRRGLLFIISGPAGAGKSEIVSLLLKKHPDLKLSISCTTRKPRPYEIDGVHYHFISEDEFQALVKADGFYEWAMVHENHYGTLKETVRRELEQGHDLILEIDVKGGLQAKRTDPEAATSIFVCPPSRENLEKRLIGRNTEDEHSLKVRFHTMISELETAPMYDYLIIHQDWNLVENALEKAADEVYSIIVAKRLEMKGQLDFVNGLAEDLKK